MQEEDSEMGRLARGAIRKRLDLWIAFSISRPFLMAFVHGFEPLSEVLMNDSSVGQSSCLALENKELMVGNGRKKAAR